MDLMWARVLFTVCVFVSFLLVILIVFSKRNKQNYDDVANIIVDDPDDTHSGSPHIKPDNGAK